MNRRKFIKTVGVGAVSLLGSTSLFAGEKEQQWIRYIDQMPKVGQNIIVLYAYKDIREISCGRVSRSISDHLNVDFISANKILNKKELDLGSTVRYIENCVGAGFHDVDDSIYWIPIKNKLPNKIPKFNKE